MRTLLMTLATGAFALSAQGLSLGVQDAVDSALKNHPKLLAAGLEVQAAEARESRMSWNRLGRLETTLLYTADQQDLRVDFPGIPSIVPPTTFEFRQQDKYAVQASFNQSLWTWGALQNQYRASHQETLASRNQARRTRQQTTFETARAFYVAVQAAQSVGVAEANLKQQQAFLNVAKSRVKAGSTARLDQLKAELAVALATSEHLEARNRERSARENLASITLDDRFRTAELKVETEEEPPLPQEAEAVSIAQTQRNDLEALKSQAKSFALEAKAASATGLPALSFRASATRQSDDASRMFNKDRQIYQMGFALTWEAFDTMRSRYRSAELRANQHKVLQMIHAQEEAIALEVRTALFNAQEARERLRVQQSALSTAEEQARIAREAYREGVLTAIEAQDAELGLTTAHYQLLKARLDETIARYQLALAIGN